MKIWFINKIKFIIFILIIILNIINYYLNNKNNYIDINYIRNNIESIYNSSKEKPINSDNILIKKEKSNIFKFISKYYYNRKITHIDSIFLSQKFRFGNQIILLLKLFFIVKLLDVKELF